MLHNAVPIQALRAYAVLPHSEVKPPAAVTSDENGKPSCKQINKFNFPSVYIEVQSKFRKVHFSHQIFQLKL